MWQMLIETAVLRKPDNIQPNLAGEWIRSILTDTPYPLTLLSALITRLRADHDVNHRLHALTFRAEAFGRWR
jgi:CRISPR-associated protein Csd1